MSKFYITTAIVYINNTPHLGFIYELTGTDVLARYHRMIGDETFFLTGSDEHSLNVERRARAGGLLTKDFSGPMAEGFPRIQERFLISYDRFLRSAGPDHVHGRHDFIQRLTEHGDS